MARLPRCWRPPAAMLESGALPNHRDAPGETMPKPIATLVVLVLVALAGPALAKHPGSAKGTVTVGDTATPLTHAYAWEEADIPEMQFEGSPARRIVVLILDRALPENARADMGSAMQLAVQGELRGVYLDLDAANGTPHNGALLARPEENPTSFTILGDGSDVAVENFVYDGGKLALASRSVKPLDLYDFSGSGAGPTSFTFDAAVEVPVEPAPKLVSTLDGDAATTSEQAVALKAFLEAVETGDAEAIRATVLSDQPGAEMLETDDGIAQFKGMILGDGNAEAQMAKLAKVYVYETHSVVLFKEEGGWSTMPLTQEGGVWKLGAP